MQEKIQTHFRYGLFTGIAVVIAALLLHVTGLSMEKWAQYILYIPFLIGLILNAQAFAKANNHRVSYGGVFSSCFKASAIITLITIAWGFLSIYIFPEMQQKSFELAEQSMREQGTMSEEQIEQALEVSKKFFVPFMIGSLLFFNMLLGAIFSLIAAAIPKKTGNQTPFENTDSQQFQH